MIETTNSHWQSAWQLAFALNFALGPLVYNYERIQNEIFRRIELAISETKNKTSNEEQQSRLIYNANRFEAHARAIQFNRAGIWIYNVYNVMIMFFLAIMSIVGLIYSSFFPNYPAEYWFISACLIVNLVPIAVYFYFSIYMFLRYARPALIAIRKLQS